jgi:hypothetical protein
VNGWIDSLAYNDVVRSLTTLTAVDQLGSWDDEVPGFFSAPGDELNPQLTAFFTSVTILASSEAVNSVSAK